MLLQLAAMTWTAHENQHKWSQATCMAQIEHYLTVIFEKKKSGNYIQDLQSFIEVRGTIGSAVCKSLWQKL